MIDLEKSKIEAEALAKLRKEQYFREVLAGELGVMIDQHFTSKEPLIKTIPKFVRAIINLGLTAKDILNYLEGTKETEEPEQAAEPTPKKETTPKEVLDLIASEEKFPDAFVEKAKKICGQEEPSTAAEEKPETLPFGPKPIAAAKVSNERIEQLQAEGLTATQIAKVTGMKPNTVVHRIAYNKDKIDRKQGVEKPEAKPRTLTAELISDEELEEQYFKRGKTIKEIADNLKIKPYGLYKRIEAMRDKRQDIAKECASSK